MAGKIFDQQHKSVDVILGMMGLPFTKEEQENKGGECNEEKNRNRYADPVHDNIRNSRINIKISIRHKRAAA